LHFISLVCCLVLHYAADLLGDRVAIMAHGKLQCCGSPLFLKNKFGVGYTLTIVKDVPKLVSELGAEASHPGASTGTEAEDGGVVVIAGGGGAEKVSVATAMHRMSARLTQLVRAIIPEAEHLSDVGAEQSFRLPFSASDRFVELFSVFDRDKEALGIAEYGISVTTLEEVFIRVGELEESLNHVNLQEEHAQVQAQEQYKAVELAPNDVTAAAAAATEGDRSSLVSNRSSNGRLSKSSDGKAAATGLTPILHYPKPAFSASTAAGGTAGTAQLVTHFKAHDLVDRSSFGSNRTVSNDKHVKFVVKGKNLTMH
jgi:hypothetical protein